MRNNTQTKEESTNKNNNPEGHNQYSSKSGDNRGSNAAGRERDSHGRFVSDDDQKNGSTSKSNGNGIQRSEAKDGGDKKAKSGNSRN